MKFRTKIIKRISTGHIIGKCYKGAGEYSHCIWKILREEINSVNKKYNLVYVKHLFPKNRDWFNAEWITCYPEQISKEIVDFKE